MHNLYTIDLGHNRIKNIPSSSTFNKMSHLRNLLLDDNEIQEIEKFQFKSLDLLFLNLASNKIHRIDDNGFKEMKGLKNLDVSHNTIISLKQEVLTPLKQFLFNLSLAGNHHLELHPLVFHDLRGLISLNLSSCGLGFLDDNILLNLDNLSEIDISQNNLHFLPKPVLKAFDRLVSISLYDNSWVCDCQIKDLQTWMQKSHSLSKVHCKEVTKTYRFHSYTNISFSNCTEPMCEKPSDLKGIKISRLKEEQLINCNHGGDSSSLSSAAQGAIVASCMGVALVFLIIMILLWKRGKTAQSLKRICVPSHAESSHALDEEEDTKASPLDTDRTSLAFSDHNFVFRHYFDHLVTDPKLMSKTSDSDEEGELKDSRCTSLASVYKEPIPLYGMESTV